MSSSWPTDLSQEQPLGTEWVASRGARGTTVGLVGLPS